jgi:hypothetical protein
MPIARIAILTVISAVFLLACAKPQGEEYFPLSEGARWQYAVQASVPFVGVKNGKVTSHVEEKKRVNGKQYYKVLTVLSGIPGPPVQVNFYRKTNDGVFKVDGGGKSDAEYLETPFPLAVGTTWTVQRPDRFLRYQVEGIKTVEVFGQAYKDCLKISYQGHIQAIPSEGYFYRARKIGTIKEVRKVKRSTMNILLERYDSSEEAL